MKALTDAQVERIAKFIHTFAARHGWDGEKYSGPTQGWSIASDGRKDCFRDMVRQIVARLP